MPDNPLSSIIKDTGPYSAEYVPRPVEERPPGCNVPARTASRLVLPPPPTVTNELDCNLNFIPTPIVPPPFIPPFEGPCPDGFHFEAQFVPAIGQYFTQLPASSGYRPLSLFNFTAEDAGITETTEHTLPEIRIYLDQTNSGTEVSGANRYTITSGQRYVVTLVGYDPETMQSKGVWYNAKLYKHGQTFKGVTGVPYAATANAGDNAITKLANVQNQRVLDYDRDPGGTTLYVHQDGFILPPSAEVDKFVFNRIVIGADPDKETGGAMAFVQEDCGGKLIGEININIDDLNIPCAEGFQFDAGYSPRPGETITVTGTTVSSATVDLVELVPTGISPQTGIEYPMPALRINTTGSTWVEAAVTSVNSGPGTLTLASALPNGTYTVWYLQRINVGIGNPTGGRFEYVKQGDCGGKLLGQILINVPEFNTPCETALSDGTLVTAASDWGEGQGANWRALKHVDRLRSNAVPNDTGWNTSAPTTSYVQMQHQADDCNYKLGFNGGAEISLPNIQIQLKFGNTTYRFKRTYTDGVTDTLLFDAEIDQGTTPGDGGGSDGERCLNCCRWS